MNDPTGKPHYVEWVEGLTKTCQGLTKYERRIPQRVFAVDSDRCPLRFLHLLLSKRPHDLKKQWSSSSSALEEA